MSAMSKNETDTKPERPVSGPRMTQQFVAVLSHWETRKVEVFGKNFQVPRVSTRQTSA
jgi:hypothetical protein